MYMAAKPDNTDHSQDYTFEKATEFSNLVPELHKECQLFKESVWHLLGFLLGIVLMLILSLIGI